MSWGNICAGDGEHLSFREIASVTWLSRVPGGSMVKNLPASAGDAGSIPGSGRSPGEGNDNPSNDTLVCLPGKSRGERNLAGYSP